MSSARGRESRAALFLPLAPALGFLLLILAGTAALVLPVSHRGGGFTPFLDALFAAASAATATGLTTQNVPDFWSTPGQLALLALTFIGGLGFMVIAVALLLNAGQRVPARSAEGVGAATYFGSVVRLTVQVALVAVGIQAVGFFLLLIRFSFIYSPIESLRQAFSLTISAFNNAGFVPIPGTANEGGLGLDWATMAIVAGLAAFGAISCMVILEVGRERRWGALSLNSKVALGMTGLIILAGAALVLLFEFGNPSTIGGLGLMDKLSVSAFESIGGRTAGFTAVSYAHTEQHTNFLMMALMMVGGASTSVAGGIKVNTAGIVVVAVAAALIGKRNTTIFQREMPFSQVLQAMTLCISMIVIAALSGMLLTFAERGGEFAFIDTMFEAVSAVSGSGLSSGLSSDVSGWGKVVLIVSMFIGRVFPLSIVLFMLGSAKRETYTYATERVTIG